MKTLAHICWLFFVFEHDKCVLHYALNSIYFAILSITKQIDFQLQKQPFAFIPYSKGNAYFAVLRVMERYAVHSD